MSPQGDGKEDNENAKRSNRCFSRSKKSDGLKLRARGDNRKTAAGGERDIPVVNVLPKKIAEARGGSTHQGKRRHLFRTVIQLNGGRGEAHSGMSRVRREDKDNRAGPRMHYQPS